MVSMSPDFALPHAQFCILYSIMPSVIHTNELEAVHREGGARPASGVEQRWCAMELIADGAALLHENGDSWVGIGGI